MLLVDHQIKELIYQGLVKGDKPYHLVNPSSLDFTIGERALLLDENGTQYDCFGNKFTVLDLDSHSCFKPNERVLLETEQYFCFPDNTSGLLRLKSSLGRAFYEHLEAGWIDAGYEGRLTLEVVNHSNTELPLTPGMRFGQLVLFSHERPVKIYNGRYQKDVTVKTSRGII